jgi:hypothetical protein
MLHVTFDSYSVIRTESAESIAQITQTTSQSGIDTHVSSIEKAGHER